MKLRHALKRILILTDLHAPYHNKLGWVVFLKVARFFPWDILLDIGDFYDGYAVSRYTKDPTKEAQIREELKEGKRLCLTPLNKISFKRKIITLGNHDIRPSEYLKEKAPAVYTQYLEEDWLGFKSSGWEVYNYHEYVTIGKLLASHEVGANGAHAVLNAVQDNIVTGHDHRFDMVVEGTATGIQHISATFGWMGDPKHAEYMHSIKAMRKWVPGFGYGYLEPNGRIHLKPANLVKNSCVVEGRLFKA